LTFFRPSVGLALFSQIGSVFWPNASLSSCERVFHGFGSGNAFGSSLVLP